MSPFAESPALPESQSGPRMPAVRNAVAVLRRLAQSNSPVSAGALARTLHIPRSSTYQLLQVLADEGFVVHVPEAHGYALGDGVFELGSVYSRRTSLEHLAQPLLARLARTVGESAALSILQGGQVLYILKEQPPRPIALVTEAGVRLPAHLTASGRAMLAGLPQREVLAYFSGSEAFTTLNGTGPTTLRELRQILAQDAARGWSVERGCVSEGISCISAAVRDRSGRPVASVTISYPTQRREHDVITIASEVVRTAEELTRRLGGRTAPAAGSTAAAAGNAQ